LPRWGWNPIGAVFRAEYVDHRDISDAAVLRDLLHPLVPDPEATLAEAQSPENKPKLRANTEQAIALGLFGSPSFIVSGELFWGDDRLEDALDWAKKTQSNEIG
jgi:2-hydroxychromene-2-carboxylate isomerase